MTEPPNTRAFPQTRPGDERTDIARRSARTRENRIGRTLVSVTILAAIGCSGSTTRPAPLSVSAKRVRAGLEALAGGAGDWSKFSVIYDDQDATPEDSQARLTVKYGADSITIWEWYDERDRLSKILKFMTAVAWKPPALTRQPRRTTTMPDPSTPPPRKGRPRGSESFGWRSFFQQTRTPVFVLGKGRRLRFANAAWEQLAGVKLADALGLVCSARRHSSPLAAALAPTPEALAGRSDRARRPAPPNRTGPPWWDVVFAPLAGDDGMFGVVGFVTVVGEPVPSAARKVPAGVLALRDRHAGHFTLDLLSGEAPAAARFVAQARFAAQTNAPLWLVGEPGAGKETAARVIHHAGARRERMFVTLDCGGVQPYLLESLLWGHGGLAGTDRVGTVYLKDPASLPRDLQHQLVDWLTDERPTTPRLICGSVRPAGDHAAAGTLIGEFHTALSVLELRVPPLRDRLADLPRLAAHFLERLGAAATIDPAAAEVLAAQPWTRNLRELADTLAEATAAAAGGPIKRDHLPREMRVRAGLEKPAPSPSLKLDATLEAIERRLIALALRKAGNNQTEAAQLLGIFRTRLARRLESLGIPVEK